MNPSTENTRTEYSGGSSSSSQQPADLPRLCSRGCGFYGSPENRGMCSKCFKDCSDDPHLCSGGCGFYGAAENRGMCSKCFRVYKIPKSEEALIGTAEAVSDYESEKIKIPTELEPPRIGDFSNKASICTDQSVPETSRSVPETSRASNFSNNGLGSTNEAVPVVRNICGSRMSLKDKIPKSEAVIGTEDVVSGESRKIKIPTELEASRIGDFSNTASICTDQSVPETSQYVPETSRSYNISNNGSSIVNEAAPVVKNRCESCRKKVGMLGFGCRCGGTFCGKHRYPEEHSCDFDFKKAGKIMIEKENPLCKTDKMKDRI